VNGDTAQTAAKVCFLDAVGDLSPSNKVPILKDNNKLIIELERMHTSLHLRTRMLSNNLLEFSLCFAAHALLTPTTTGLTHLHLLSSTKVGLQDFGSAVHGLALGAAHGGLDSRCSENCE
jgi:hypothetical protein